MKRIVCLLLTLTLVFGMAMTVSAEEAYTPTDSYVLNFTNQDIEGYEDYDNKRLYASPHIGNLGYVDNNGKMEYWANTGFSVLNMINTGKLTEKGEGAYASIPVYCCDAITDGVGGYAYRRVNLEDSGYFTDEMAGKLRAVFMNSFPYQKNMSVLAAAVNAWAGDSYEDVVSLTESEAISAAQAAIWKLANEEIDNVIAPYNGTNYNRYDKAEMVDTGIYTQKASEYTDNNITALYNYLINLEPMKVQDRVITDSAFSNTYIRYNLESNGTYTAIVTTTVSAEIDDGDSLSLTAVSGNAVSGSKAVLNGTNTYTLTIPGLSNDQGSVTVNIDGEQDASDVFLYDPKGGREASQTMIGYDSSALPVHAEVSFDRNDRIVNIHKTTGGENKNPLANIQFDIYYVGALADYADGKLDIGPKPTEADIEKYTQGDPLVTLTTNKEGFATYNFGSVDGVYLVIERSNEMIEMPVSPFFLQLPYPNSEGGLDYTVNVYPKNTVTIEDVVIVKDVTQIDNDHGTYPVGQNHTWIIRSSIPAGLATGLKYEITDTLNYQLTYTGNVKVTVSEKTAPAGVDLETLIESEDYFLTVIPGMDAENHEITSFKVALTANGMKKIAAIHGSEPEVRVYFDAYIDSDAILGTTIPNQAHISYENNVGIDFEKDSDIPEVHTGGLKVNKVDGGNGKPLGGAIFKIARMASSEEVAAETFEILKVGEMEWKVVYVDFYTTEDMSGEKVIEVTTGDDGVALLYGLAFGEYYLVETQAPAGYNKLPTPVNVTVNGISHLDDDGNSPDVDEGDSVTVENSTGTELPSTGGSGTTMLYIAGSILILGALVLLVTKRRMRY